MVEQAKMPGYYGDGGGLVLRIAGGGNKVWLFRYKTQGRVREMGLGPVRDVSLAEAREAARGRADFGELALIPLTQSISGKLLPS
jgi:hypothetical protein